MRVEFNVVQLYTSSRAKRDQPEDGVVNNAPVISSTNVVNDLKAINLYY